MSADREAANILRGIFVWSNEIATLPEPKGYSELEIASRVKDTLEQLRRFRRRIDCVATPVTSITSGFFAGPCGIYFLLKGNEVVYVGQSKYLHSRISTHKVEGIKDFDRAAFIEVDLDILDVVEKLFIESFNPRLNVHGRTRWVDFSKIFQIDGSAEFPEWLVSAEPDAQEKGPVISDQPQAFPTSP